MLSFQPQDAITKRAESEGTKVSSWTFSDDVNLAGNAAKNKDVALVFITADSGYVLACGFPDLLGRCD